MIDLSIKGFRSTWQWYPENLMFFSADVLEKGMNKSHEAKVAAIAELMVRVFLSNDRESDAARIIEQHLHGGELNDLLALFPGPTFSQHTLDGELWATSDDLSICCQTAVRNRMRLLLSADGLIPVYLEDNSSRSFLIPFSFDSSRDTDGVFDLNGNEIPEWSEYARALGITTAVKIHLYNANAIPLSGNSLMLPLQMAWWRRNKELPEYNVFRLVATGCFDSDLRLASVATVEKAQAVLTQLQDAHFFAPESLSQNPEDSNRSIHYLPLKMERTNVLERIRPTAERLAEIDLRYALKRMDPIASQVHFSNYSNWSDLAERLKNADVFDRRRYPDAYLSHTMLLSEAYRHAGQNGEAEKYNRRARDFAKQHGEKYVKLLLRLEIETLVDDTDNGKLENAVAHSEELLDTLNKYGDNDLWMRFHGSLGQAIMYGTLLKKDGFSKEKAKEHLEKAAEMAYDIGSEPDIAQDLNYIHLYHAIFEPCTDNERLAFEDALKQWRLLDERAKTDEDRGNSRRNLFFLKRSQAFAWYRKLLMDGKAPAYSIDSYFDLLFHSDQGAEDWIQCCVAKCLGALEAANGRMDKASKRFQTATNAIKPNKRYGIKGQIHLTALAQAFKSLGNEKYRKDALDLLEQSPALLDFPTTTEFRDYLLDRGPFPALSFWY